MRPRCVTVLVLLPVVAAGVGYYLGATRAQGISRLTAQAAVPLEYLVSAESFSEVDQARASLEALAAQRVELVGVLADEAVAISQAVGRQEAVAAAFCHLSGIPLEFRAQSQIERSLVRLGTVCPLPDDTHEHPS